MEYDLLVERTRASMMNWEIRRPFLESMAKKNADSIAELHDEYTAYGEAEEVADAHIDLASNSSSFRQKEGLVERMSEK